MRIVKLGKQSTWSVAFIAVVVGFENLVLKENAVRLHLQTGLGFQNCEWMVFTFEFYFDLVWH